MDTLETALEERVNLKFDCTVQTAVQISERFANIAGSGVSLLYWALDW